MIYGSKFGNPFEQPTAKYSTCETLIWIVTHSQVRVMKGSYSQPWVAQELLTAAVHLQEPYGLPYRMWDVCDLFPCDLEPDDFETIIYHRACYQCFTMTLHCMAGNTSTPNQASISCSS